MAVMMVWVIILPLLTCMTLRWWDTCVLVSEKKQGAKDDTASKFCDTCVLELRRMCEQCAKYCTR